MFEIVDTFIVDFWLEPARYKKANGTETPFWSYYDYEAIRDKLLANLARWETPGGERIAFRGLMIEAEPFAVTLTFTFMATFRWCPPVTEFGEPFSIGFNLCTPSSLHSRSLRGREGRSVSVTTRFSAPKKGGRTWPMIYVKTKEGRMLSIEGQPSFRTTSSFR